MTEQVTDVEEWDEYKHRYWKRNMTLTVPSDHVIICGVWLCQTVQSSHVNIFDVVDRYSSIGYTM